MSALKDLEYLEYLEYLQYLQYLEYLTCGCSTYLHSLVQHGRTHLSARVRNARPHSLINPGDIIFTSGCITYQAISQDIYTHLSACVRRAALAD